MNSRFLTLSLVLGAFSLATAHAQTSKPASVKPEPEVTKSELKGLDANRTLVITKIREQGTAARDMYIAFQTKEILKGLHTEAKDPDVAHADKIAALETIAGLDPDVIKAFMGEVKELQKNIPLADNDNNKELRSKVAEVLHLMDSAKAKAVTQSVDAKTIMSKTSLPKDYDSSDAEHDHARYFDLLRGYIQDDGKTPIRSASQCRGLCPGDAANKYTLETLKAAIDAFENVEDFDEAKAYTKIRNGAIEAEHKVAKLDGQILDRTTGKEVKTFTYEDAKRFRNEYDRAQETLNKAHDIATRYEEKAKAEETQSKEEKK